MVSSVLTILCRKTWSIFISKKLAIMTITALTITIIIGAILSKQASLPGQQTGLFDRFYLSGWVIILIVILFLNTLACTVQQFRVLPKTKGQRKLNLVAKTNNSFDLKCPTAGKLNPSIARFLAAKRLAYSYQDNAYVIEKNKLGKYGSVVFHISLLLMLLGFTLSSLMSMEGTMVITEGQTRPDEPSSYVFLRLAPFFPPANEDKFAVTLQQLKINYPGQGVPDDYSSAITLTTNSGTTKEALVTKSAPAYLDGISFHQDLYGYAPAVVIKDKTGRLILETYVNLATRSQPSAQTYEDSFTVPGTELKVGLTFFPDLSKKENYITGSYQPVNPGLQVLVSQGEQVLFSGSAAIGETIEFGNYQVGFPDFRRWSAIMISKDPGLPLVYSGFLLAVAGLIMIYLLSPQKIYIYLQQEGSYSRVIIGGTSRRYPQRFQELIEELKGELETYLIKEVS